MKIFKATFIYLLTIVIACIGIYSSSAYAISCSSLFKVEDDGSLQRQALMEIAELPVGIEIPAALYDRYSVDQIARALVSRIRNTEIKYKDEIKVDDVKTVDLKNEADIILYFWSYNTKTVSKYGFLNQHLSGHSKGVYSPARRQNAEDILTELRMGYNQAAKLLRPKSALVNVRSPVILAPKRNPVSHYGDIGAVLKNSVKDRSTWTSRDSLGLAESFDSETKRILNRGTFERGSLPRVRDSLYYEAQIYGELSFNDVAYFLVTEKNVAEAVRHLGKPVYLTSKIQDFDRIIFQKGEFLIPGAE